MYAAGLRVSEVITLGVGSVQFQVGCLLVRGKGDKERLVPVHETALKVLKDYLEGPRGRLLKGKRREEVFLNNRGDGLSRMGLWKIIRKYLLKANISGPVTPTPCATPLPPIFWKAAPTSGACSSCWGTATSAPPRFTPT